MTEEDMDAQPDTGDLRWIDIHRIDPTADNPRRQLADIDALAANIAAVGVLSPVVVEETGDRFRLVAGARRLAAAKQAGLHEITALVRALNDSHLRKLAMLSENGNRVGLTPLEEAAAYVEVLALPGVDPDGFARQLGRPLAEVDGRLALLRLPNKVQKQLAKGEMEYAEARLLAELAGHAEDVDAALQWFQRGWTMAHAVTEVRRRREREERKAETTALLEAKKVQIVAEPGTPGGQASTRWLGYGAVHIKHSTHRKQPCHAAYIGWDSSAV